MRISGRVVGLLFRSVFARSMFAERCMSIRQATGVGADKAKRNRRKEKKGGQVWPAGEPEKMDESGENRSERRGRRACLRR